MMRTIYIEAAVAEHPRTRQILDRYPHARIIQCRRYGEIFNRKSQNFRLQKKHPALILAHKHRHHVLAAPAGYGLGGRHNYYFSHMLNCVYDCRYCFLQGMYRSAHHVLFVNYEDFMSAIHDKIRSHNGQPVWFYSGYDCDSLACEPLTGFASTFLPFFRRHPDAWLELRTKSTQIRSLLNEDVVPNCVIAFSFTPANISAALEKGVPEIDKRLLAIQQLQQQGWAVGLRFDPLLYQDNFLADYRNLFSRVFDHVDRDRLHSVSLGSFRVPQSYFRQMSRLYPEEKLFAGPLDSHNGMIGYHEQHQQHLQSSCTDLLLEYIPEQMLFPCNQAVQHE